MIPGLAMATLIGGVIVWGRVRDVEVPRVATWDGPVTVCASPGVDTELLGEAVELWREHGHDIAMSAKICDVQVSIDPDLDERTSLKTKKHVRARTAIEHVDGRIVHAEVRLLPEAGLLAMCHELGHALGYMHPRAAPTGHLLHPHDPSLEDWRGLDAPTLVAHDDGRRAGRGRDRP